MANEYPTGVLSLTLELVDRTALTTKSFASSAITKLAAGNVPASAIVDIYQRMHNADVIFAEAASVSGIADYAKAQKANDTLDVVAAFSGMRTAVQGVNTWIVGALPTSGGYVLLQTLEASGPVDREFTPTQTAGLRTALQAVVDQIQ